MRYLLIATLCLCSSACADELYEQLEKEYLKKQAAAEKRKQDYLDAHKPTDEELKEIEEREKEKEKEKEKAEAALKLQVFRYYGKAPEILVGKEQHTLDRTPYFKLDSSKKYKVRFGIQEAWHNSVSKEEYEINRIIGTPFSNMGIYWSYLNVKFSGYPSFKTRQSLAIKQGLIVEGDNYANLFVNDGRPHFANIERKDYLLKIKFQTGPSQLYNEGSAMIDEDVFAKVPEKFRDGEYWFQLRPHNRNANLDIRVSEIPDGEGGGVLTQVDKMIDNLKGLLNPIGAGEE